MQVFAAFLAQTDYEIGRVLNRIEERGEVRAPEETAAGFVTTQLPSQSAQAEPSSSPSAAGVAIIGS